MPRRIRERRIAEPTETTASLAVEAGTAAIKHAGITPDEIAAMIPAEIAKWGKVIRDAGIAVIALALIWWPGLMAVERLYLAGALAAISLAALPGVRLTSRAASAEVSPSGEVRTIEVRVVNGGLRLPEKK